MPRSGRKIVANGDAACVDASLKGLQVNRSDLKRPWSDCHYSYVPVDTGIGFESGLSDDFFKSVNQEFSVGSFDHMMRPLAFQNDMKLRKLDSDAVTKCFAKNGRLVLYDEIDAALQQGRRKQMGFAEDDFFSRSVLVTEMIRPSQRLGINSAEEWTAFRQKAESTIPLTKGSKQQQRRRKGGLPEPQDKKCNFCFNNKEPVEVWSSHNLKDDSGKIACHILRKYVCPKCKATGDKAHTNRYCPKNQVGDPVSSIKDLNTGRTSAGRFSMNAAKR